jgi:hypothetical protein
VRHFGGVPLVLNIDNLKAAVLQADWFDPEINPKLALGRVPSCLLRCRKDQTEDHAGKNAKIHRPTAFAGAMNAKFKTRGQMSVHYHEEAMREARFTRWAVGAGVLGASRLHR